MPFGLGGEQAPVAGETLVADPFDARDRVYVPGLRPLGRRLPPDRLTAPNASDGGRRLRITVRDQGAEASCTGQALAGIVDILRLDPDPATSPPPPASARMLLEMAKSHGLAAAGGEQINSLRSVLKGFFHNGVCPEADWPYVPGDPQGELTVARARAARAIGLGAFFRVRPRLDDLHAAVAETGAVFVSAATHAGWAATSVAAADGRIIASGNAADDLHAFVLVGYDDRGFVVLNAWGSDWGGFDGLPGIAHWSYGDWADSIRDAWVLRLSVSTPEVFELTQHEQGLGFAGGPTATRTVPRAEVVGHYLHLDDGRHMQRGSYPSTAASVEETCRHLATPTAEGGLPYNDVLVWFEGGLQSLDDAVAAIAADKTASKQRGVYRFDVLACPGVVPDLAAALADSFAQARRLAGRSQPEHDRRVEERGGRIARALRRDLQRAAQTAAAPGGAVRHCLATFAVPPGADGGAPYRLHLAATALGAVFLAEALTALRDDPATEAALNSAIASVQLILPALTVETFADSFAPLLKALAAPRAARTDGISPAVLRLLPATLLSGVRFHRYAGSSLALFARAGAAQPEAWLADTDAAAAGRRVRRALRHPGAMTIAVAALPPLAEAAAGLDIAAHADAPAVAEAVLAAVAPPPAIAAARLPAPR